MNLYTYIGMIKALYHFVKDEKLLPEEVLDSIYNESLRILIEPEFNDTYKLNLLKDRYEKIYKVLKYFLKNDHDVEVELIIDDQEYKFHIFDDLYNSLVRDDFRQILIRTKVIENDHIEYMVIEAEPSIIFDFIFGFIDFETLKSNAKNIKQGTRYYNEFNTLHIK